MLETVPPEVALHALANGATLTVHGAARLGLLADLRQRAGLTQRALARKMGRSQSWVFKSESAMRRIDIAEFLDWCVGCDADPLNVFADMIKRR